VELIAISGESERRLALARRCAPACAPDEVVILSGSAGFGIADERSDVDLYVFGNGPKKGEDRFAKHGLRRVFETPTPRGGMLVRHEVDGITLDVEVVPRLEVERVLNAVLREHDVDPEKQRMVRGLLDAVPIGGASEWKAWCERLQEYPPQLGLNMLRAHLHFQRLSEMKRRTLDRGDPLAFYGRLTDTLVNALGSLAGLNRYYLGVAAHLLKWTDVHLGRMSAVPANAAERLKAALRQPTDERMEDLDALIVEILDLVERMAPQVHTRYVRPFLASSAWR
jgi:hypothetical protein